MAQKQPPPSDTAEAATTGLATTRAALPLSAEAKKSSKALLYPKLVRYVPSIAFLVFAFFASEIYFIRSPIYFSLGALIFIFAFPASIALASRFVGIIWEAYGHEFMGLIFKSFVTQAAFAFFFFDALFSLTVVATRSLAYEPLFLPLILVSNALILNRFADLLIASKKDQAAGLCAKRLATALGIAFIAALISLSPLGFFVGYPLYYSALAYAILSIGPLIAYSKATVAYREAGLYLMRSSLLWTTIAFFIGVAALALTFLQNNVIVYTVIIAMGAIAITTVGFRIYSLGASKIAKETQEVYQKHSHKLQVVQDESFDFLRSNVEEFIRTGRKENLLIALTTLLTNAGFTFELSEPLLRELANYEVPAIHKIPYLSIKNSLALEVEKRTQLVNETFNHIAHDAKVVRA